MPEHCVFPARKLQSKICRIPSPRSRRNRRQHRQNYQVWRPADNEPPSGRPCLSGSLAPCRRCRQRVPPPRQLPLSLTPTSQNRPLPNPDSERFRTSGRIFRPRFPDFRKSEANRKTFPANGLAKSQFSALRSSISKAHFPHSAWKSGNRGAKMVRAASVGVAKAEGSGGASRRRRDLGSASLAGSPPWQRAPGNAPRQRIPRQHPSTALSVARPIAERRPANAKRSLRQAHRRDRRETLSRASGTLAKGASRRPYSASFFARSSLMILGLPWPRMAFMHWPTKKPMTLVLPSR